MKKVQNIVFMCIFFASAFMLQNMNHVHANPFGNPNKTTMSGYAGRYFLVGFMQNELMLLPGGLNLTITISTYKPTNVRIAAPINKPSQYFQLPADTVFTFQMQYGNIEMFDSEIAMFRSIEIEADQPITVSGLSSQALSTDGYSALPVNKWGREYVVHSWPNDIYMHDDDPMGKIPRSSEFMVIACQDNTVVEFTPRARTENQVMPGVSTYINLNKGQCYLVKSDTLPAGQGDLSGTIIRGDKPIGVFSGHLRTSIPMGLTEFDSKNHLTEMLYPTEFWGKKFATIPFLNSGSGDFFRIHCIQPGTNVSISGASNSQTFTLNNPGDFKTLNFVRDPLFIEADKPISVVQYMSTSYSSNQTMQEFDPCMVLIPSTDKFVTLARFHVISNPENNPKQFTKHFINVVCSDDAVNSLTLDNRPVLSLAPALQNQRINGTTFFYASIPVIPGKHTLSTREGAFIASLYGLGPDDAYGYPLAFGMEVGIDTSAPTIMINDSCGIINGKVQEILKDDYSGLFDITVIRDSSINVNWSIPSLRDDDISAFFSASIIDKRKDGILFIEAIDNAGNVSRYKYLYKSPKLSIPDTIVFPETVLGDSLCIPFTIKNNGTEDIQIKYTYVVGNKQISFKNTNYPFTYYTLKKGDSASVDLCFVPGSNTDSITASVVIELPCGQYATIPVYASSAKPAIEVIGYDFGNVKVGDRKNGVIKLINKGTSAFIIQSIATDSLGFKNVFSLDTNRAFPVTMNPRDTIEVQCSFSPKSPIPYVMNFTCNNDRMLTNSAALIGNGIQPRINGFTIDWNNRRTGTVHLDSAIITNTGNDTAIISFDTVRHENNVFQTYFSGYSKDAVLGINESTTVYCVFIPDSSIRYQYDGLISYRGFSTATVPYSLRGNGTQPIILPNDIYVGKIIEKQRKDTSGLLFTNSGNESLTIDSISIVSGDTQSFIINSTILRDAVFTTGSEYQLPISFIPQRPGRHEIFVDLFSDAAPEYKRIVSRVRIWGEAISVDTLSAEIEHSPVSFIRACTEKVITITVKNTGNKDVTLDSLYALSENPEIDSIYKQSIILPATLQKHGGVLTAYFTVFADNAGNDSITFIAILNDTMRISTSVTITFRPNYFIIGKNLQSTIVYTPGEEVVLQATGTYDAPNSSDVFLKPYIDIQYSPNTFSPNAISTTIEFTSKNITTPLPAIIRNPMQGHIIVESQTVIPLQGDGVWSARIPLQSYLSGDPGKIKIFLKNLENSCFIMDSSEYPIEEIGICAPHLRNVSGDVKGLGFLGIAPHPMQSESTVSFLLSDQQNYTIELIDILGSIRYSKTTQGMVGLNKVTINTSDLPNGNYILVFQTLNAHKAIQTIVHNP